MLWVLQLWANVLKGYDTIMRKSRKINTGSASNKTLVSIQKSNFLMLPNAFRGFLVSCCNPFSKASACTNNLFLLHALFVWLFLSFLSQAIVLEWKNETSSRGKILFPIKDFKIKHFQTLHFARPKNNSAKSSDA